MTTFWIILGAMGAATVLVGAGLGLGRWSRRDEIDELEDRLAHAEQSINNHIAYEDNIERAHREARADLMNARQTAEFLQRRLDERRIGAMPLHDQVAAYCPEPAPIDKDWLAWTGSLAGHTGAWATVAPFEVVDLAAEILVAA